MAEKQRKSKKLALRSTEYFQGPLPHPSILQKYEDTLPGATDRIIAMVEREEKHRQDLEKEITRSNLVTERRAMILSFILTLLLMATGAILISKGFETAGFLSLFGPSIFHAANYIFSKYEESKDKE